MRYRLLQKILEDSVDNKEIYGVTFCIHYKGSIWCGSAGNLNNESEYFITGVTKLYTTALILNLRYQDKLIVSDKIEKYLDESTLSNLHKFKGVDFSREITIEQLLSHTSGIPDYLEEKDKGGFSLLDKLLKGEDQHWSFDDCINFSKTIKPYFEPGKKNKARYSNTNFQLLGRIIENITGQTFSENLQQVIFDPLGLSKTYLYQNVVGQNPDWFYSKDGRLNLPQAMSSFNADAGIVSNSYEMAIFLEAFFKDGLFPNSYLKKMQKWNKIFPSFESGIGIQRFKLSRFLDPLGNFPELIGYIGRSGALAFYNPQKDIYIVGTVNKKVGLDIPLRIAIRLIDNIFK